MVAVSVTINDQGNLMAAVPMLVPTIHAAVDYLDRYLVFRGTVDVAVNVVATANGRFAGNGDITHVGQRGGFQIWESSLASEARTGSDPDPAEPDLVIYIDPNSSYLANLWWDPIIGTSLTAPIPGDRTDAFSVVLHELLHGMGIIGWRDWDTGALPGDYASAWDYWVSVSGGKAMFNGPATTVLLGEPVEVRLGGSQGATHLGNGPDTSASAQPWLERSNLNGYYYWYGERYTLGRLELALLQDVGWTLDPGVAITDVVNRWNDRDTPLYIVGWDTAETLGGGPLDDRVEGRGGNDFIEGGSGDDTLLGGVGDDTLLGGAGGDKLEGGDGNDEFRASAGADVIDGGAGIDRLVLDYSKLGSAVTDLFITTWLVDIGGPPISVNLSGAFGNQTVGGIEHTHVVMTAFDDKVTLTDRNDTLYGGAGNDWLDSASGDDLADGGEGNDYVYGSNGNDTVHGGAGDDTLGGGQGNDTLIGGPGYDRARFGPNDGQAPGTALKMDFTAADFSQPIVVVTDAAGGKDTLQEMEAVLIDGTPFGDWIVLGSGHDIALGKDGNDTLVGGDGNDLLVGGAGDDHLRGGAGNDTLDGGENGQFGDHANYGGAPSGVKVDLVSGIALDGYGGTDTLIDIEHIQDSAFDDLLIGNAATNWFHLGAGDDSVDGGGGRDVVFYEQSQAGVNINLLKGIATGAAIGTDALTSVEAAHGSHFDDAVTLGATAGYVFSRGGNDLLTGGSGEDTFFPGSGNDTVDGGAGFDGVDYSDDGFDGTGPIEQAANVNLASGVAIDGWGHIDALVSIESVTGTHLNDTLVGGAVFSNLRGGKGDDYLQAGAGGTRALYDRADGPVTVSLLTGTSSGADGNDMLVGIADLRGSNFSDLLIGDDGPNSLQGRGGSDTLIGGEGDDQLYGLDSNSGLDPQSLDGADLLQGGDGNDMLYGGAGEDTLAGNAGNDTLDGGGGTDCADYRFASGAVFVNLVAGIASGGDGDDVLRGFENLRGSDLEGDVLIGGAGPNRMEGHGGDDLLIGLGGDDALDGGPGIDVARYLGGRNAYTVTASAGTITVAHATGTDTLTGVERLQFVDLDVVFDVDGTPGQAYRLYQAAFDRTPDTGGLSFWIRQMDAGATLLQVADAFIGSAEFIGNYGANPSSSQFVSLLYKNVLDRNPDAGGLAYWAGLLDSGALSRAQVLVGFSESAENKANLLPVLSNGITYAAQVPTAGGPGNDALSGMAAADWLRGEAGRDLLSGLAGNDRLDGGAGLDTAGFSGARSQYTVVCEAAALMVIDNKGADGIDNLIAVERLQFTDKNLAFDIDGNAGQAYRLYQAAFDRVPDIAGLSFWIDAIDDGAALQAVAQQFIASPEFIGKYGANPSNGDFVTALYQNVLNRAPDAGGLAFWVNQLDEGTISRPEVLIGFSESAENQTALIGILEQGIEYVPFG